MRIYEVETARVYRANGRRFLSRSSAIRAYAVGRFKAKHPCDCEAADYADGYPGYDCGVHQYRDRVLPRYVRFIRRQLGKHSQAGER